MKAMLLRRIADFSAENSPLELVEIACPEPASNQVLIRVTACGVCHTELDEIEGRTPPSLPRILGHQVVGRIEKRGRDVSRFKENQRVGVAWIYSSCGKCRYCLSGRENLCPDFVATGRDADGGYAEFMVANEDYIYPIPDDLSDLEAAPLLCAGAIGLRSLRLANIKDGDRLGLTGFGASGHLVLKMVKHLYPSTEIYVFARSQKEREFAIELGAKWAGDTTEKAPFLMDAIIDTTPVWKPIVEGLDNLARGGRFVINAIRKEDIDKDYLLTCDYARHLWLEKEIKSVANVTRKDVSDLLGLAKSAGLKPEVEEYGLYEANRALWELKTRRIRGAKVLRIQ
ncbi:MAG: zinc-dependent alcohol dehydrogenase family protein [bacterium]